MDHCLFCSIVRGDQSAHIVYRDDCCIAFLDIFPRSVGHTVVIPIVHTATLSNTSPDMMGPLWQGVQNTIALLARSLSPDGFTIGINHGKVSGQTVDHLHIHIIPRFLGDGGGSIHSVVDNPPSEDLAIIRERILHPSDNS